MIKTPNSVTSAAVKIGDWPSSAEEVSLRANLSTLLKITSRQAKAIVKPQAATTASFS